MPTPFPGMDPYLARHRPRADVYLFGVRDSIPDIPIPLRPDEDEPVLALNRIVHDLYDRARLRPRRRLPPVARSPAHNRGCGVGGARAAWLYESKSRCVAYRRG